MKKLHCAVIGCGRIGCGFDDDVHNSNSFTHSGSYIKNPHTELVALCDIDKKKLSKYGKKFDISRIYQSSSKMYKHEQIDCVSICTLVDSHYDLIREAVQNNVKGIFLEKPMTDTLKHASEIIDLCKKNNVVLLIDHKRRFHPLYHQLKTVISNGTLGKILHVNTIYTSGISNTGSHLFDIIRFLFGDVQFVQSLSQIKHKNSDPNLVLFCQLKNGVQVSLNGINSKHYGLVKMEIFGNKGKLEVDLVSHKVIHYTFTSNIFWNSLKCSKMRFVSSKKSEIMLGVEHLVSCIRNGNTPLCDGNDGYKSLELIIASLQSSIKNKKIELPLTKNSYKIISK